MGGRAEEDAGEVREEGYRLTRDEGWTYVIFDPENPLAWILSDFWGTPPDAEGQEDEGDEEDVR